MNKRERTARLVDAIGGGICPIHGEYIGIGKYHLRACPLCDIEAHSQKPIVPIGQQHQSDYTMNQDTDSQP